MAQTFVSGGNVTALDPFQRREQPAAQLNPESSQGEDPFTTLGLDASGSNEPNGSLMLDGSGAAIWNIWVPKARGSANPFAFFVTNNDEQRQRKKDP